MNASAVPVPCRICRCRNVQLRHELPLGREHAGLLEVVDNLPVEEIKIFQAAAQLLDFLDNGVSDCRIKRQGYVSAASPCSA